MSQFMTRCDELKEVDLDGKAGCMHALYITLYMRSGWALIGR